MVFNMNPDGIMIKEEDFRRHLENRDGIAYGQQQTVQGVDAGNSQ
jgi:hypothetical protein